jgi:hypothetical protein
MVFLASAGELAFHSLSVGFQVSGGFVLLSLQALQRALFNGT